ncbi:MAG: GAF domain-containing SpoIIE family protein phosphatase [Chthoniobacteraceae bacterium]
MNTLWWIVAALVIVIAVLAVVFRRTYRRQQERIGAGDEQLARVEAEERRVFDFLHVIGEALSADMHADDLHRMIVEGAIGTSEAHGGAIYLLDRKGTTLRRGFGTPEGSIVFPLPPETAQSKDLLQTFLRWHAVKQGDDVIGAVWRDREAQLVPGDDPRLPAGACGSLMIAPLIFSEQLLGVFFVTRRAGTEPFPGGTFTVFCSLAEQAAFALYSSSVFHEAAEKRRIDEDLAVAHEIQRILLPMSAPDVEGYEIAGINVPARQVSGDYYDYIAVDENHCGVAIADVSGKGVAASLIMAMCRSVLRAQAGGQLSPGAALRAVNAQLYPDIREDMFISMAYAILDRQSATVTLCRAGHDAPLLYRASEQTVSRINPPGMALGIDIGGVFDRVTGDFTIELEPGDCLLLYTDGITEAVDAQGDEFGLQRVIDTIIATANEGAAEMIARLTDDVRAFIGPHPQPDDITIIAIRKK